MDHVYHWKHGWIPLDHAAALSKAKGNHGAALQMLHDAAHSGAGIHSRQDVAKATLGMHEIPPADRHEPMVEVVHAADKHGLGDAVPASYRRAAGTRAQLRENARLAQHAQDLRAENATGGYKTELNGYYGGKGAASTSVTERRVTLAQADREASAKVAYDREQAREYRLEQKRRKAAHLADTPPPAWADDPWSKPFGSTF